MIAINLLPSEFQKKSALRIRMPALPYFKIAAGILITLLLFEAVLGILFFRKQAQAARLDQNLQTLSPHLERIESMKAQLRRIQTKATQIEEAERRPFFWTELLQSLLLSVTDDVWLSGLSFTVKQETPDPALKPKGRQAKKHLSLQKNRAGEQEETGAGSKSKPKKPEAVLLLIGSSPATGEGTAAIGKFIQSLKDHPFFQQVTSDIVLEKIDRKVAVLGPTFEFTVSCKLKPEWVEEADHEKPAL